jgi:hypothetical protein
MAEVVPRLTGDCVARDWQFARPDRDEANRLDAWWTRPNETIDSARQWWSATPQMYRQWAVCEGHFLPGLDRVLGPVVKEDQLPLRALERFLLAMVDTTKVTRAAYIASRIRGDTVARHIEQAGIAMGNAHRYEAAIADDLGWPGYAYNEYVGSMYGLLGRVYLQQGRLREARSAASIAKQLFRWHDPTLLSDIALQQRDTARAVRDLAYCRVAVYTCANASPSDTGIQHRLHTLYAAIQHGSLAGFDTVMKRALFDSTLQLPIHIDPWEPPNKNDSGGRVAVLQYYTWVDCGRCAVHTIGVNALKARFGNRIVVLAYHYVPPLTVPGWPQGDNSEAMFSHMFDVGTQNPSESDTSVVCDWWIDGSCVVNNVKAGLGPYGGMTLYDQAVPGIARQLTERSVVELTLQATRVGDAVTAEVTVNASGGPTAQAALHPLKLQLVLVEDSLMIPGANSPIQDRVVRSIAGDSANGFGVAIVAGLATQSVRQRFDLAILDTMYYRKAVVNGVHDWDASTWSEKVFHIDRTQLSIVAYLQDQTTGEIVQAVQQQVLLARPIKGSGTRNSAA